MLQLPIEVIVNYPKRAQAGVSYLMSIDLRFDPRSADWPFDKEEIPIHCLVSSPLFSIKLPAEPVFYLHRFGGTYGRLSFKLKADTEVGSGQITLLLINNGLPVGNVGLETTIVARAPEVRNAPEVFDAEEVTPARAPATEGLTFAGMIGSEFPINDFAWSPDGSLLASASASFVDFHDAKTKEHLRPFMSHGDTVWSVAWSPDGRRLASASEDMTVRISSFPSGILEQALQSHQTAVRCLAWSGDGRLLASGSEDGAISLWEIQQSSARIVSQVKDSEAIECLAWSPDGRLLATGSADAKARLWQPFKGQTKLTKALPRKSRGQLLAHMQVRHTFRGHTDKVRSLAWSPEGRWLATGSSDMTIRVWDAETGQLMNVLEAHTDEVTRVCFSPDGRLLASNSADGITHLWRSDDWRMVATIHNRSGKGALNRALAFHPSGERLATLGEMDKDIHLWNLDLGFLLGVQPRQQAVSYTTAKVVLLGDSGVGKSGLALRLADERFALTESTHGQRAWTIGKLGGTAPDGTQREVVLWDFAGQLGYRLIHTLFLDDVNVALILFDSSGESLSGAEYWLKELALLKNSEVRTILVGARADRGGSVLARQRIEEFCRRHNITGGYVNTSAKTGEGVNELIERIRAEIPWEHIPSTITTDTFRRIKEHLLAFRETGGSESPFLTPSELRKRLEKAEPGWEFTDAEMMTAVRLLAAHSYVYLLPTSSGAGTILLRPDLVNNLASSIVMEARMDTRGFGVLEEERLAKGGYKLPELLGLSPQEANSLLDAVMVLFLERYLCHRATTDSGQPLLIFPSLVRQAPPSTPGAEVVEDTQYVVGEMGERLYATMAVLLSYTNSFTRTTHWRDQSQYEIVSGEVCGFRVVRELESEASFVLYFGKQTLQQSRSFFKLLFENLLSARGVKFKKLSPAICPQCDYRLGGREVATYSGRGRSSILCPDCGGNIVLPKTYEYEPSDEFDSGWLDRKEELRIRMRAHFEASLVWVKGIVRDRGLAARRPSLYISYNGRTAEHQRWVLRFINDLKNAGLDVVNSGSFSSPASDSPRDAAFISRVDSVLLIGASPRSPKHKAQDSPPGESLETSLIRRRAASGKRARHALLPILLGGTARTAFPPFLADSVYMDCRREEDYFKNLFEIVLMLYQIPYNDPAIAGLADELVVKG